MVDKASLYKTISTTGRSELQHSALLSRNFSLKLHQQFVLCFFVFFLFYIFNVLFCFVFASFIIIVNCILIYFKEEILKKVINLLRVSLFTAGIVNRYPATNASIYTTNLLIQPLSTQAQHKLTLATSQPASQSATHPSRQPWYSQPGPLEPSLKQ